MLATMMLTKKSWQLYVKPGESKQQVSPTALYWTLQTARECGGPFGLIKRPRLLINVLQNYENIAYQDNSDFISKFSFYYSKDHPEADRYSSELVRYPHFVQSFGLLDPWLKHILPSILLEGSYPTSTKARSAWDSNFPVSPLPQHLTVHHQCPHSARYECWILRQLSQNTFEPASFLNCGCSCKMSSPEVWE